MYTTKAAVAIIVGTAVFSPFVSLAAHAEGGAALTGDVGTSISVVEPETGTATARGEIQTQERTDTTLGDDAAPLIINRADAKTLLASSHVRGTQATSSEQLRAHEAALVSDDPRVSSIALSSSTVMLSYQEPAKLFGLIGIDVPVKVSVSAMGTSSIDYPWYSFLLSTNKAGLALQTQAAVRNELSTRISTSTALSTADEVRLVDALHAVLRSEADARTSGSAGY